MRKSSLTNALIAGLAGVAGIASSVGNSFVDASDAIFNLGHRTRGFRNLSAGTARKRNRTDRPRNRGIIARRKANKVARKARKFNAQRSA